MMPVMESLNLFQELLVHLHIGDRDSIVNKDVRVALD